MVSQEELNYRQPIVFSLIEKQLSGPGIYTSQDSDCPKNFVDRKEASKIAGRNYKMLWRLFNLYGLNHKVLSDGSVYYDKSDLEVLVKDKKPKGMKAIGLGTIHKALLYRLSQSKYSFEKEKRFPDCHFPFDIYLTELNIAVEVQGPQHFLLAGNWTNSLEKAHENLAGQLLRDNSKKEYCDSHGIDLVWITVDSDLNDFFAYIEDRTTCSKWFHRGHLPIEDWDNDFEKWMLFSYKKEEFLKAEL